jgi:hypothetical protein
VRALPSGDFDVRDGAFDLAIIPDLAAVSDPASLLARVRRLVGSDGAAIVAAKNPESRGHGEKTGLDYYELYDLVALQFASVRMIGQVPFYGVAIAELGEAEGAPQVSVDTQLVTESEAPELFVALASQREVRLDPYAIVQLPPEIAGVTRADDAALDKARVALAEAQLRAELALGQLEELKARAQEAKPDERAIAELTQKLRDADARAGDNHVRAERLTHDIKKLEEELQRQRDRGFRLTREVEDEKKARQKAEVELGMVRKNPELAQARERVSYLEEALQAAEGVVSALQSRAADLEGGLAIAAQGAQQLTVLGDEIEALSLRAQSAEELAARLESELATHAEANAGELVDLEEALRERAHAIKTLEQELGRRERLVQELVAALEETQHAPHTPHAQLTSAALDQSRAQAEELRSENAQLRQKLDALALEAARREGDVQTSAWRIAELEREVARVKSAAEQKPASAPASTGALQDEIDVLKQALAQEHDARRRAESGEELARARAELERQASLIEQLSRELEARDRERIHVHPSG